MTDWKADPTAHEYRGPFVNFAVDGVTRPFPPDACQLCGQPQEQHTGANLPVDQQLRALGPEQAPRLL